MGYSNHEYELLIHLNTHFLCTRSRLADGHFFIIFSFSAFSRLAYVLHVRRELVKGKIITHPLGTKGGENIEPNRTEWQKRCIFNGFCKTELIKIPRSTVQYRRTSSFELLKRYLEERADEWSDW